MKYPFTCLLATLALLAVACGSEGVASTPTPTVGPTATVAAALPTPTIVTLDKRSSEYWELQGLGQLRQVPETIHATSPQLDDETLVVEWTTFFGGTKLADWASAAVSTDQCSDGTIFDTAGTGEQRAWYVEPLDESRAPSPQAIGGNAIVFVVKKGFRVQHNYYGARDGLLVNASAGLHKSQDPITGNDIFTQFVATESLLCD